MTYFSPGKDWKGEFGFDGFAYNFDHVGVYVSPTTCNVELKGLYSKHLLPLGDGRTELEEEPKFARFNIKKNGEVVQDYALRENGECYFYVNVPFTSRWKVVDFDFWMSDDRIQHFFVSYDEEGRVEEMIVVLGVITQTDNEEEPDCQCETGNFTNDINEVLSPENVERLNLDTELIKRIYRNEDMVSDSLKEGDERIKNAVVICPSNEITVIYKDRHKVIYKYEAAQLSKVTYWKSFSEETENFIGSQEEIVHKLSNTDLAVIDALLHNPFYNHPACVYRMDEAIAEVEMKMQLATSVKCTLEVEQVFENAAYVDLEHHEIKDFDIEVYKVLGGKANVPRGWENGKVRYETVDYGGGADLTGGALVPLWRQYVDKKYFVKQCDGRLIFYPAPSLALVNYAWIDKKRGLENDMVLLRTQTLGDKKVHFEVKNKNAFDFFTHDDLDEVPENTIALSANNASDYAVRLKVKDGDGDDDDNLVGMMDVKVFDPVGLKLCVVNVNFDKPRPFGKQWSYKNDRFLEILGQAGVIFNEIDDSKSLLLKEDIFSKFEAWNDTLYDNVLDYKKVVSDAEKDFYTSVDEIFLTKYPEYIGYFRVYLIDKCMADFSDSKRMRLVASLLGTDEPPYSSLLLFKRSIEACNATESNPLAYAMLRCLGLHPFASPENIGDGTLAFQCGTSTNMMDNTEHRHSLTLEQINIVHDVAVMLQSRLQSIADNKKENS